LVEVSGTSTTEEYSSAMAELWGGLSRNLSLLDRLAADPDSLTADDAGARLQRLQYSLHTASEEAYGLDPPGEAEPLHHELTWALGGARDATAEVAEALDEQGIDGVAPLLHEWRGALFRVRLARLRLAAPKAAPDHLPALQEPHASELARPLVAILLALIGALAFAVGAVLAIWPVWVAGIVAATASVLWYRP
jgi:hypothetical protein